jgi:diguanylate cyclase (GGDEF)-like protein
LLSLLWIGRADAAERWAGLAETVFQNYGREQGLPHPVPIALAQDGDGFIWMGTQGGLARWDGYRFRGYQPDPKDPGSLPDSYIQTLHADPKGRLWVGTSGGGLVRYDRDHDRFIPIDLGPAIAGSRTHIGAMADDGTGGLWVGTDSGLFDLAPDASVALALHHEGCPAGSLPEGPVQAILPDRAGRLWVGTGTGLARRDAGTDRFVPVPFATPSDAIVGVTALFEDGDGRIWIGTNRHGAYVIETGADTPSPVRETEADGTTPQTDWVSSIVAANPHELWFATRANGILVVDPATKRTRRIRHDRTLPNSLAHDDIWALLRDSAGSMWAGGTGGLSYHTNGLGAVSTLFGASNRPNGITDADVYSVLGTRDGRVWLGFITGGVDIIDPVAGRVAQLRPDPTRPETALPKDVVLSMAEADDGDVFVGTFRGLYRVDHATHRVDLAQVSPKRDPYAAVSDLLIDDGTLWVGGVTDGLWGVKLGDGRQTVFGPAESSQLNDKEIDGITRGLGQDLWIGNRDGLNRFDLATRVIERILPDPADPTALPARFVSSTLLDRQGRLWVSTFGGGIAVMTGRNPDGRPVFHRLNTADGLPHINVDKLLLDAQGKVWAGTDDGLAVIDPTTFAIRALRHAEGSPLLDYFANAGSVDTAGEPLFGAKGGLAIIQGDRLKGWNFRPPVVVSDIRVGGSQLPSSRFNGAGSTQPLVLTPETNSLAVEFSALDFTAPDRNRYAYRLDGFDRDWVETDATRRLAAYTNLPPGSYTLRLRGSNRDGVWTERELAIPIRVQPAWYQTSWFMIAAGLTALAMVAAIVRSRTAYLRRRQAELERQIADRTADLRAANERLFELAAIDPLTGCANRRHFVERAHELIALSRRPQTPVTLAIMDLDEFKQVNDTYGHPAGDEVLRMIGRTGRDHMRVTDLLGRIGGEEFALLMPNTDAEGARHLAERLREAVGAEEAYVEGTILRITVSFGLAELQPDENFESLYARADAALYAAKEAGRNRVVIDANCA